MDHLEVMKEFASIIRGEHVSYSGDKRYNAEWFLVTIRRDMPELAESLAVDIGNNLYDFSTETGLPERTLLQARRFLLGYTSFL